MATIGDLVLNLKADSSAMTKGLVQAQRSLASTTEALKREAETFGKSRKEIALYDAAKNGASRSQTALIASLHDEIEAKKRVAKATEEARQKQQQFASSTAALQREAKTFGMSRKQIALYDAAKQGASKGQISMISRLHDEIDAKQKAARATEQARTAQKLLAEQGLKRQKVLVDTTSALRREANTVGMSRKQIALYDAAQQGASKSQLRMISHLHEEINAKQRAARATDQFRQSINNTAKSLVNSAFRLTAFTAAATAAGAAALAIKSVKLAAEAEQTAISFEVMTGSVQVAKNMLGDLRDMAKKTPFEFRDLTKATQTMLQFGIAQDTVLKDLGTLSNVASGNAEKLGLISLAYGQISANGRLMGQDLLQLVNAGFNPLQEISKKTGESMTELRDRMSRGEIGFEEVRQAFIDATSAGGRFFKMNERQSQTLIGKWSALKDEVTVAMIKVGDSIAKNLDLKEVIGGITQMAGTFEDDFLPSIEKAIKLMPDLMKALGDVGKAATSAAGHVADGVNRLQQFAFIATSIASGMNPAETRDAFLREFAPGALQKGGGRPGAVEITPVGGDMEELRKRLRAAFPKTVAAQEARAAAADKEQMEVATRMAGKAMARFIRNGIESLQSGVMSLGGPVKRQEEFSNRVGTLEAKSQESFEVLRANVGEPDKDKDVPKKQLKEAEKTNKLLEKWLKSNDPNLQMNALYLKGLD